MAQAEVCKTFYAGSIPAAASMKIRTIAIVGFVLLACACSSSKPAAEAPSTSTVSLTPDAKALKEVSIMSCGPDARHNVEIKGTAHNTRPDGAMYTVKRRGKNAVALASAGRKNAH